MEVRGILAPFAGNFRISRSVDNTHGIPIGLRIICHESFKMRLGISMPSHDVVEVVLEKHLSILVLRLEVAASDGHIARVPSVIYMASHGKGHLQVTFVPFKRFGAK